MSESQEIPNQEEFQKAKDLIVTVKFERDDSYQGVLRSKQVKALICDLILLAHKRGRPSKQEEKFDEAA